MSNGTCTVQRRRGDFCDAPSMDDSPFPICQRHALRLFLFMKDEAQRRYRAGVDAALALPPDERKILRLLDASNGEEILSRVTYKRDAEYVYYVAVGEHIKIGVTSDIKARMRAYQTGKLLAVEPGDGAVEARRHRQFAHALDAGREWFKRTPDLIRLIDHLRDKHPIPDSVPKRMLIA